MAEGGDGELGSEQAVASRWSFMRSELNQLHSKVTEMELELSEHALVIGAIKPLDPARKCFRLIGGVLVERTVGEVLPAVQRNREGLEDMIKRLAEALERKKREIAEFEAKYKIKIRRADEVADEEQAKNQNAVAGAAAQGVLVGSSSS
ncbi:hypothetical protein SELMODRAFT_235143 [Selaginella moellendorffii]|uniref:Prefoldin subunit 2 n=1 Tax=Selaginella moellendorffii TaxID=88036 RepID=D8SUE0_SELML|nr:probable prefoldin subunit 2 [Selaginella moellendorffii]EFJ11987.1 hypothetical protein SELMODRAFT_235143 [Selaginella moellendorffii]|eukprot:XP_002986905.1 probable prefoldin subunit 2 [Selaginella moellendorffii]